MHKYDYWQTSRIFTYLSKRQWTSNKYNFYAILFKITHIQCSLGLSPPVLSPKFSSVPISPITNTLLYCQTQLPPQLFRHKSRKTNSNSPISTAHNYLLTAVYWSVIMECQNWSLDTVIDLIVEGQNRWSVVLIRIITCIYFSSDYICTFNPE
jgi:hypothetical protein